MQYEKFCAAASAALEKTNLAASWFLYSLFVTEPSRTLYISEEEDT
jgi:hypothetical protein